METASWITYSGSGQWRPYFDLTVVTDLCIPNSCPETIPNGALSPSCTAKVDTSCEYTCDYGHNKTQNIIRCEMSTSWSVNPHALCTTENQCPYIVANGDLSLSCRRHPGDTCTFTCREGYLHSEQNNVSCGAVLTWSQPFDTVCKEIRCPSTIPNGHIKTSCTRKYNEYCDSYWCDPGFSNSKVLSLRCNATGQWEWNESLSHPCAKIRCPSTIPNGQIRPTCTREYNEYCDRYWCDPGYYNSKVLSLRCNATGQWEWNGSLSQPCARQNRCECEFPHGRVIGCSYRQSTYKCDKGYKETTSWITCSSSGQWQPISNLCIPKSCPEIIPNGVLSPSCSAKVNTSCEYTCDYGYKKTQNIITCETSTNWSVNPHALCTREHLSTGPDIQTQQEVAKLLSPFETNGGNKPNENQCPYIVANGDLSLSCRRHPGDTCTFTCRDGYFLSEQNAVSCGAVLTWSQPLDTVCKEIRCPNTILNGHINTSCTREYKEYCKSYWCDPGYRRETGLSSLKCNATGQWEWNEGIRQPCAKTPSNSETSNGTDFGYTVAGFVVICVVILANPIAIVVCILYLRRGIAYMCKRIIACMRQHKSPQPAVNQSATSARTTQSRRFDGLLSPTYMMSNQDTSLPTQQNNEHSLYVELQPTSQNTDSSYAQEPPAYNTLSILEPQEPPPSYEEVTSNPTDFNVQIQRG